MTRGVAQALNIGSLGRAAPESNAISPASSSVPADTRVKAIARDYGFGDNEAVLVGATKKTRVYEIDRAQQTLVISVSSNGDASAGLYAREDLEGRAVTLRNVNEATHDIEQLVLAAQDAADSPSSVEGLARVSGRLYVDERAAGRIDTVTETLSLTSDVSTKGTRRSYTVVLFGSD